MTTSRIEEIVDEFYPNCKGASVSGQIERREKLRTALTQAHQAGIDEAVEKCIEAVKNSRTLPEQYGVGVAETTARGQAIMDIKAALQDNKTDV